MEFLNPLEILRQLIEIPSVNPMGREASGAIYFETALSEWLVQFFHALEVPVERQEVFPGRFNIVARVDCPNAAQTVLLDAHQDTAPVEGMTVSPFQAVLSNGQLHGRGACDVKGGMAAMLAAFARIALERPRGGANVTMACTCDEEHCASGAEHLARTWSLEGRGGVLLAKPPDVCLVAEPTDLHVVVAHRGVVRWKLRTTGRACHSSRPSAGVNAIYKMAQLVRCLERYAQELPQAASPHPLCGFPTLSVGRIHGGTSVNIVPDECVIEIDRRVVPGENPRFVIAHVSEYLRSRLDVDFDMSPAEVEAAPLVDSNNAAWADRLLRKIESIAGIREKQGAWYGTNASCYSAAGAPALVCGPGSIAQAHTADEWIDVAQLHQASEIYYQFCIAPF